MNQHGRILRKVSAAIACAAMVGCVVPPPVVDAGRDVPTSDLNRTDVETPADIGSSDAVVPSTDGPQIDVVFVDIPMSIDSSSRDVFVVDDRPDASVCVTLSELYAAAVRNAQSCSTANDCAALVCETLCCSCEVYVQSSVRPTLAALSMQYRSAGCDAIAACLGRLCEPAQSTTCSSNGRCVTLRAAADN